MRVDAHPLCCYVERVTHALTLGDQHTGLRADPRPAAAPETVWLSCYGVALRVTDAAGLLLCDRLRRLLPPEWVLSAKPAEATAHYTVTGAQGGTSRDPVEYTISRNGVPLFTTVTADRVYRWLRRDIDRQLLRQCHHLTLAYAAVVVWRGIAIVIPGRTVVGQRTLVRALLRCGADYYSDDYALIDECGKVHPYRNPFGDHDGDHIFHMDRAALEPAQAGLVVAGRWRHGATWQPDIVRGSAGVQPLLRCMPRRRGTSGHAAGAAAQLASHAVGLQGAWHDGRVAAHTLMALIDDALINRAVSDVPADRLSLGAALAQVAERRWRHGQTPVLGLRPERIEARYVCERKVLAPEEREQLHEHVPRVASDSWQIRRCGAYGDDVWVGDTIADDAEARAHRDAVWRLFEQYLRSRLIVVRQRLQLKRFTLGRIEWRVVRVAAGAAFVARPMTKDSRADHQMSAVFFLHGGAEVRLHDHWVTPGSRVKATSYVPVRPGDNSVLFLESDSAHEIVLDGAPAEALAIVFTIWTESAADAAAMPAAIDRHRKGKDMSAASPSSRHLVAVVVPAYRSPTADEQIALRHLRTHLGSFDRYVIGANVPAGHFADFERTDDPSCAFVDRVAYNRMLYSEAFFRAFARYRFILIYQLDCLVFSNALESWCDKDFDYIGAPWFELWHHHPRTIASSDDIMDTFGVVGNGGFSLRKVDAALAALAAAKRPAYAGRMARMLAKGFHEDAFWSLATQQLVPGFRLPTAREAMRFAFESAPPYCYRENQHRLPFGCHGWAGDHRAFWEPFLLTSSASSEDVSR